jgi:hypothetical protein
MTAKWGAKASRVRQLAELGFDEPEIIVRMTAEGWSTGRGKGATFPRYVKNVLYRQREVKGYKSRLSTLERELIALRKLLVQLAETNPRKLREVASRIVRELPNHESVRTNC